MSSEKSHGVSPELAKNAEILAEGGQERLRELQEKLEQRAEQTNDNDIEKARHEALELAHEKPEVEPDTLEYPQEIRPITKADKDKAFNDTMHSIRKQMNPAERTFSKIIHNPVVEKTSQVVGSTIARPNLILGGAIGTIVVVSIVYIVAKKYGYTLSGFEAIGSFVLGWVIGALVEYIRVGFRGKTT